MPNILVVTPSLPVNTVADVIAYAKAAPDGINMASSGNGTLQHLLLELFRARAGIKINHVPYRGGGLAVTDVMAGQVKFVFSNGSAVVGLIKGGKVKAIAHTGKGRLASLPDIPPMSDTLPGFEGYDWNGVFTPHGAPPVIVQRLNAAVNKALTSPPVMSRFAELNVESHANTPEEFRALRRRPDGAVEPRRQRRQYQARLMNSVDEPPRIAGPVPQPKRPRVMPPPGAWDSHFHIFGPADKFPYRRDAAIRRPTRRSSASSRCSTISALPRASWCRAMPMSTTTASCSMRSTRFPERLRGVAITDTRIAPEVLRDWHKARHARPAVSSCSRTRPITVRGVGLDVFEVFRKTMAELGWVAQFFCDHRMLAPAAAALARYRARCR